MDGNENPQGLGAIQCVGDGGAGGFKAGTTKLSVTSVTRNGAGDYTVEHASAKGYLRKAGAYGTTFAGVSAVIIDDTHTDVATFDAAGAAADHDFWFECTQYPPI